MVMIKMREDYSYSEIAEYEGLIRMMRDACSGILEELEQYKESGCDPNEKGILMDHIEGRCADLVDAMESIRGFDTGEGL